jgi:hypothetical protein
MVRGEVSFQCCDIIFDEVVRECDRVHGEAVREWISERHAFWTTHMAGLQPQQHCESQQNCLSANVLMKIAIVGFNAIIECRLLLQKHASCCIGFFSN